jgi:uncharacterized protein (DUF2336 family)
MNVPQSFISELEDALRNGSNDRRRETLRKITDLFLDSSERFSEDQIGIFDDVLTCLIERIETRARAELSRRLAPVENAPVETIGRLARDGDIAVAGPVLTQSTRLQTSDLVEISRTGGQAHLLAIAARAHVAEPVTDVLVERGDSHVVEKLVRNAGARFSDDGFSTLAGRAEGDQSLIEHLGQRLDIPIAMFRELLAKATDAVKERLLSSGNPAIRIEIQRVLAKVSAAVGGETHLERDREAAQRLVLMMQEKGELDEAAVVHLLRNKGIYETIAALSALCNFPFELMERLLIERSDTVLIPLRAADFSWSTVREILRTRSAGQTMSDSDLERARAEYGSLSKSSAERVLRFWQVRQAAMSPTAGAAGAFELESRRIAGTRA